MFSNNPRRYGQAPFRIVVVHGGPGAAGQLAPVARELAAMGGVLEPLQTATSLAGQIEELAAILDVEADGPVTLIGHSWGAWLSFFVAAKYPTFVKKLLLIASGPFEDAYAADLHATRLARLSPAEQEEIAALTKILNQPSWTGKDAAFARFGTLCAQADTYDPLPHIAEDVDCHAEIFQGVWLEAADWRRMGKLLELGLSITCPVVAIHGDYDPHCAAGVQEPLSQVLQDFRMILLEKCGHEPWFERQARAEFYRVLKQEL